MQYKEVELILEDGSCFKGKLFGHEKEVSGEIVFNTSMTGYPESLTDPSYRGQILVLTYPLIGNYGIPADEAENGIRKNFESDFIHVSALVIDDLSQDHNHWNSSLSLDEWLKQNKIPGIFGIDTRALTKKIRDHGTLLAKIKVNEDISFYDPNKINLVEEVSIKEVKNYGEGSLKIVVVDCGVKNNIIRCLLKRGASVIRVPYDYDFTSMSFDGVIVSNGPGDPKQCSKTIENIKKTLQLGKPFFGICLGNQLLGLAIGMDTYKMKFGHRSSNQPCIDLENKRCYITSQNHGFALDSEKIPFDWKEWFVNANDSTNEGIKNKEKPFFSVQFHPEGNPGPRDTEFLFDVFLNEVKKNKSI
ncbi:glutamine-hydrolyzing carbamoyl-phosphate synthase small subunit [Candidatus Pacearchaeota archaeon]|nr:glutamine-hydrolyzing carbamoyl-phosphate synthase small subunit [Candidatus Pacearchaeota archaeon]